MCVGVILCEVIVVFSFWVFEDVLYIFGVKIKVYEFGIFVFGVLIFWINDGIYIIEIVFDVEMCESFVIKD